jgi:hypothetical protein
MPGSYGSQNTKFGVLDALTNSSVDFEANIDCPRYESRRRCCSQIPLEGAPSTRARDGVARLIIPDTHEYVNASGSALA